MRTIKVYYANGDTHVGNINGTNEEITAYYVGQIFNLGDGCGGDKMVKCTKVEFLD